MHCSQFRSFRDHCPLPGCHQANTREREERRDRTCTSESYLSWQNNCMLGSLRARYALLTSPSLAPTKCLLQSRRSWRNRNLILNEWRNPYPPVLSHLSPGFLIYNQMAIRVTLERSASIKQASINEAMAGIPWIMGIFFPLQPFQGSAVFFGNRESGGRIERHNR